MSLPRQWQGELKSALAKATLAWANVRLDSRDKAFVAIHPFPRSAAVGLTAAVQHSHSHSVTTNPLCHALPDTHARGPRLSAGGALQSECPCALLSVEAATSESASRILRSPGKRRARCGGAHTGVGCEWDGAAWMSEVAK